MSFDRLYRASFYLMLFLATLALNIDVARDHPLAPLYPLAVAVAGFLAYFTVDRDPRRALPSEIVSILAFVSVALFVLEWNREDSNLILALGHWLVYLQLIKMFRPKSSEDDWFLFLLGLTQVVVGAFQPGERVGLALIAWAIVALWTLRLFHLRREALRSQGPAAADPYPGLVDRPFVFSIGRVALLTLVIGGLLFLLMPRWSTARGRSFRPQALPQRLTGFTDSVKLGQMGEILENDTVVMSVELSNEIGANVDPGDSEPLWRGVALQDYERGRWKRWRVLGMEWNAPEMPVLDPGRSLRQRIRLEASDTDILFGMRPVYQAQGNDLAMNVLDGSFYRTDLRPLRPTLSQPTRPTSTYNYTVVTSLEPGANQPYERLPSEFEQRAMLELPEDLAPTLRTISERVLQGVSDDATARARALERFLRDGEFRYTLQQSVIDPSIDPVADFLLNRKRGHCEYFASSLALLLRSAGIPSRVVNGFKGGDWNTLARLYYVRQKHAHSWVEAFLGIDRDKRAIWLTLDPTPASQRDETVAQIGNPVRRRFRTLTDFLRYIWVFYFVGYDAARQETLIYGPARALWAEAQRGFGLIRDAIVQGVRWLLHFPDLSSLFSVRGFVASFTILTLLALGWRLIRGLARRLGWFHRRASDLDGDPHGGLPAYRRLIRLLADAGLRRPPSETPREFARRVTEALQSRGIVGSTAAGVPSTIVEAFYQVRYGRVPLAAADMERLEAELQALEAALRPASA